MRPLLQFLIGGRSHSTHIFQALTFCQQRAHRLALVGEARVQLGRVAVGVPAFFVAVGMEHDDEVEQLAAAQRVVHQMGLLAAPDDHLGQAVFLRPLVRRQHGAIGDVAGNHRLAVADDLLAHRGPQPVAADQRRALVGLAGFGLRRDAVAVVVDRDHLLRGGELDEVRFLAGVEDDIEHVGAVNDAIGRAVFVVEALVDLQVDDGFGGDRSRETRGLPETRTSGTSARSARAPRTSGTRWAQAGCRRRSP